MDLRPQGHDIIRTWLFSTIVRSYLEFGRLPWSNAALSGWILDPDRKKMSKSVGNVVTPRGLLEQHGSDAVRYWAASGRPGTDTAFEETQMTVGRKLALKMMNASKFVLSPKLWAQKAGSGPVLDEPTPGEAAREAAAAALKTELAVDPVDVALLTNLSELVSVATRAYEEYDYARALERTEAWFWDFCDNYLELVKSRAYGEMGLERATSARTALAVSLSTLLRLFAPIMPFVTEEIWSWWQEGSVHRAPWPEPGDLAAGPAALGGAISAAAEGSGGGAGAGEVYTSAVDLLAAIRRAKSEARVGPRSPVERVTVSGPPGQLSALRLVEDDLRAAQNVAELVLIIAGDGEPTSVDVRLASS
jgi:valyl-tRNA synthetase